MESSDIRADRNRTHAKGRSRPVLPGQVFDALGKEFLDAARCRDWLVEHLHPEGPRCPCCGMPLTSPRSRASFRQLGRVQCTICGRFFTALSGTMLNKTGLEPAGYVLLCLLMALGQGDQAIAAKLNVNRETVRRWRLRFKTLERIWSEQP
ncbi:MAG: helix-turn-helix domain-containing protein [Pseudomonadota bacterium]